MTKPNLRQAVESITTARGFTKESGFRVRAVEEGYAALELAPKESLVQFLGYVHAGVVTGLADHAAGACYASVLPEGRLCLTIELKINFMRPAKGDLLVAEATILSRGASIGVVRADVFAETAGDRLMVATALVTLKAVDA
jgi:uncharacterized protein (TIGR00369 family)